jgi:hypothetical protein
VADTNDVRSWFRSDFAEFLLTPDESIVGRLAARAGDLSLDTKVQSMAAWRETLRVLREATNEVTTKLPESRAWQLLLEFEVPRRRKRIDVVLLARDLIFLIEVKAGAARFERAAEWQAEQYALDLRDFHEPSRHRTIVPALVPTKATASRKLSEDLFRSPFGVLTVQAIAPEDLGGRIISLYGLASQPSHEPINLEAWEGGAYRPTPSIVEAACQLYESHDVREISLADAANLNSTVDAVVDLITRCKRERRKGIAFITGAPGSGKTLAGLQVVHDRRLRDAAGATGVFLSGNMPLVEVIRAALADAASQVGQLSRGEAARRVKTFIQHAYDFRDEHAEFPERKPSEHVVLFDEAQRAWDARQVQSWTSKRARQSTRSEPEILLEIMSRVPEWSVVVAMVGGGQEINRGEAGLGEWGRALVEVHPDWLVVASGEVLPGSPERPGGRLFSAIASGGPEVVVDGRLHLSMNVRSPRAERLNQWVDALLDMRLDRAKDLLPNPREFPLAVTRSLPAAREWLRDRTAPDHRCGLVASADARRLRAWGLETNLLKQERGWASWFLKERGDVRASYQLEVPATNFDCQGLELDWVGVCWGNDLVPSHTDEWKARKFVGSRWTATNPEKARYILNSYRVLLTRARRGQVIWIPEPDGHDGTLPPDEFQSIWSALISAGAVPLD